MSKIAKLTKFYLLKPEVVKDVNVYRLNRIDQTKLSDDIIYSCGFKKVTIDLRKLPALTILDFLSKVKNDKIVMKRNISQPHIVYGDAYFNNDMLVNIHSFERANVRYIARVSKVKNAKAKYKLNLKVIDKKLGLWAEKEYSLTTPEINRLFLKYVISVNVLAFVKILADAKKESKELFNSKKNSKKKTKK